MDLQVRQDYLAFGRPNFSEDEIAAVVRIMRSGWIGQGNETAAFEQELSRYIGTSDVITVNSCTSALFLALKVAGIGEGDEVIVPSLTWCSTANAALYLGAEPVFCDVDPHTLNVTADTVSRCITRKTRAAIVVHFGGLAVDVAKVQQALPDNVQLIEDAAHALGSRYSDGRMVGSAGNLTCFSFYANKNLSTAEGGAIAVGQRALADRLRSLRLHALPADAWKRFINPKVTLTAGVEELGYKMNYTDLQAGIGRVQLARLDEMQGVRTMIARRYSERLRNVAGVSLQQDLLSDGHARHLFVTLLDKSHLAARQLSRDSVLQELRGRNIGASVHYHPLHLMPLYAKSPTESLPVTEAISSQALTLPISASMSTTDADYVVDHLMNILR